MVNDRGIPVYLDYNGVQTEADLLANMNEELPFDHLEIGAFVEDELDEVGLLWLRDTVPAFARFLQDRLGPIDVDRISIDWLDDEPMVPALN